MAKDMNLVLRITGDASGLKRGTQEAQDSLREMAGTALRAAAAFVGFTSVGATLRRVAMAGDEVNAALARVAVTTGNMQSAVDIYSNLYQLSLRTGVATNEAAGAFQRFAIAAREAGASRAQILAIVQLMQQAGALAGASTQETASATLQLGQALASGVLQGDELRSILEAMPNLAQSLASELGVGIGELRKMGEEGKLTADVVIPALVRSGQRMNEEFAKLPPSLSRSIGILGEATGRLLADLDRAAGLSRLIAAAFGRDGVAGSIDTFRREMGLGTPVETAEVEVARLRSAVIAARRAADEARAAATPSSDPNPRGLPFREDVREIAANRQADEAQRTADAFRAAEAALRAGEERLAALRGEANAREQTEDRANADQGAEANRRRAATRLDELRDQLQRERGIRREAREAEERIAAGVATGAITEGDAASLRAAAQRREREDLARLNPRPAQRAETDGLARRLAEDAERLTTQLRSPYDTMTAELGRYQLMLARGLIGQDTFNRAVAQLNENAREPFDRLMASLDPAQAALQQYARQQEVIADAMARNVISEDEYAEAVRRSSEALGQRLRQAEAEANGTAEAQRRLQDGARSLGLTFSSSFEDAILEGKKLGDVLKSLEKDIARIILRKAITEPLGGAIAGGVQGIVSSIFSSIFHTGGIVGAGAPPGRAVPASVFAGAPRFHDGGVIGPDEVPAILRKGEGVFTPEQMAALAPADGVGLDPGTAPAGPPMTIFVDVHSPVTVNVNISGGAGGNMPAPQDIAETVAAHVRFELASHMPAIIATTKNSIRGDVKRMGADRALGAM